MANQGAKKRYEDNAKRIQALRIALLVGIVMYVGIRLVIYRSSTSGWHYAGLALTLLIEAICYSGIAAFASPTFNDNGELIDGGADLSMGGMCAYYHDLLYITIFIQATASLSDYFWYFYLLVPGYALFKLVQLVVIPYFNSGSSGGEMVMDEATRKKLERTEKRAERRRMKSFR